MAPHRCQCVNLIPIVFKPTHSLPLFPPLSLPSTFSPPSLFSFLIPINNSPLDKLANWRRSRAWTVNETVERFSRQCLRFARGFGSGFRISGFQFNVWTALGWGIYSELLWHWITQREWERGKERQHIVRVWIEIGWKSCLQFVHLYAKIHSNVIYAFVCLQIYSLLLNIFCNLFNINIWIF